MKTKTTKRSRAKNFNSRLAAYSATATAALLAAPAADATIQNITTFSYDGGDTFVPTAPDLQFAGHGSVRLTFKTGNHQNQFYFSIYHSATVGRAEMGWNIAGDNQALNLGIGSAIMGKSFRPNSIILAGLSGSGNFLPAGAGNAVTGYVGFKDVVSASHTYYGWLRVKVTNDSNGYPDEVSLVSKDSDPGIFGATDSKSAIIGGDGFTAGSVAPIPEPSVAAIGGLGLLSLGAAGVREMRRRKSIKTEKCKK